MKRVLGSIFNLRTPNFYLLSFIIILTVLAGCNNANGDSKEVKLGQEKIPVKLIPLNSDISASVIHASGQFFTENEARLSFKIGGVIESILVKEGDQVKKGQLLATLKTTEISSQVQQVQLSVEKAQRDYQRVNNLYNDSVATLEQLQNAKTGVDIARQNLQQVNFNRQYASIHAPADGFIIRKLGNAGEVASSGNTILLMNSATQPGDWVLRLGLPDREWSLVGTGDKATIETDAFPNESFPAVVSKKALAADPVSGSFPIELRVELGQNQAALGMYGKASIQTKKSAVGYSIPYEALLEANGMQGFVFVSNDQKTVKKVPVRIGSISNQVAWISEGLEGYKYLVSAGSPYLNDQSEIRVVR